MLSTREAWSAACGWVSVFRQFSDCSVLCSAPEKPGRPRVSECQYLDSLVTVLCCAQHQRSLVGHVWWWRLRLTRRWNWYSHNSASPPSSRTHRGDPPPPPLHVLCRIAAHSAADSFGCSCDVYCSAHRRAALLMRHSIALSNHDGGRLYESQTRNYPLTENIC